MESIFRWPARRIAAIAVLASAVLLVLAMGAAPPASAAAGCAWQRQYGIGGTGVGDPDANATYWATSLLTLPDSGLTITGTFPAARYMNYTVYRNTAVIASAHLYDAQIQPETGVNPFLPGVEGTGTYQLQVVEQNPPADPAPNTLYVGSGLFSLREIVFRVYDPADVSEPAGTPTLPQITPILFGFPLAPLPQCATTASLDSPQAADSRQAAGVPQAADSRQAAGVRTSARATPAPPVWSKSAFISQYPDPDSAYLSTTLDVLDGALVVVRASMPTFPDTNAGEPPWETAQVRYWSLCENGPLTITLIGCIGDFQAVQDAGTATFVISTPANRPANATAANGINWIPFGNGFTGDLLYRQVLASPSFSESITDAPAGALASTMGSYLPQIAYCTEVEWAAAGADGCLGTAPSSAAR